MAQTKAVHGYRGPSKKKHNGIVPVRRTDKGLLKTVKRMTTANKIADVDGLLPVKVVAHVPTGNRLVGVLKNAYSFSGAPTEG